MCWHHEAWLTLVRLPFETVKDIPVRMPFKGNLTNSEPISTPTPALTSTFIRFLHSRPLFPCFNNPRQQRAALSPRVSWNYSNQLILNPLVLPCLILPTETSRKVIAHVSPESLCLLTDPGSFHVALWDMACPLLLGTVSNRLSFHWQVSPDILASLDLNNNFKNPAFKNTVILCVCVLRSYIIFWKGKIYI